MLERYAMKVARTVLRGGEDGNILSLPDQGVRNKMDKERPEPGKRHRDFVFFRVVLKQEFHQQVAFQTSTCITH